MTKEVKKLWAIQLESLERFKEVCEKQINGKSNFNASYEKYIKWYKFLSHFMSIGKIKQAYVNACAMANGKKTKKVSALSVRCNDKRIWIRRECFDNLIDMPFENTTIACPKDYDEILTNQFGDWHVFVQNGACHEVGVFDADIPYKEYFKK